MRSLDEWLSFIETAHPSGIEMGLERVAEVARAADLLPPAEKVLIVAGTNGKGSNCIAAEALLRAQGLRVGTTLSPHIVQFNERIRLDGAMASDETICAGFEHIDRARGEIPLTYFEFALLAALSVFVRAKVDAVVLEVGLGGRLDAANVCDADVAIIASIGLDHTQWLGDDLDSIGREKAGVMRAGASLVLGSDDMPSSITQLAAEHSGPVLWPNRDYQLRPAPGSGGQHLLLGGESYFLPDTTALAAVNIASASMAVSKLTRRPTAVEFAQALTSMFLPGRCQTLHWRGRVVIVDAAHNQAAADFLTRQLLARFPGRKFAAAAGFFKDKPAEAILRCVDEKLKPTTWGLLSTSGSRGQSAGELAKLIQASVELAARTELARAEIYPSLAATLDGLCSATSDDDIICLFGSFDVVSAAFELLGQ
ncbi:MAG: Mur ligase family protein [Pseudomonadaceae bacterium]|nr:Mur ligase family protein [Pseudomonadaceae bacterium]